MEPRRPSRSAPQTAEAGVPWVGTLLSVSVLTLVLQLFPGVYWAALAILDVRLWTWRAYAVTFALALVALVALRAWRASREDD
jgi:hypothetical protein